MYDPHYCWYEWQRLKSTRNWWNLGLQAAAAVWSKLTFSLKSVKWVLSYKTNRKWAEEGEVKDKTKRSEKSGLTAVSFLSPLHSFSQLAHIRDYMQLRDPSWIPSESSLLIQTPKHFFFYLPTSERWARRGDSPLPPPSPPCQTQCSPLACWKRKKGLFCI